MMCLFVSLIETVLKVAKLTKESYSDYTARFAQSNKKKQVPYKSDGGDRRTALGCLNLKRPTLEVFRYLLGF